MYTETLLEEPWEEWDDPEDLYPLFSRIRAVKKRLEAELGGLEAESSIRLRINALKTRLVKYIDNIVVSSMLCRQL